MKDDSSRDITIMQMQIEGIVKVALSQETEIKDLKIRIRKYDVMATKWGGFLLGLITVGVLLSTSAEKLRDKIVNILIP